MASTSPVFLRLMANAVAVANHAGNIIREVMSKGDLGIVEKGVNDPQTEADRRAQQCIIGNLNKKFPLMSIIGEEDLAQETDVELVSDLDKEVLNLQCPEELRNVTEEDFVVWVDPLDGTAEYTEGMLDHVTVLIGIAHKNRPVGGVIHQPYYNYKNDKAGLGRTMWGIPGIGVGGFKPLPPPEGKRLVVTTRSHMTPVVQQALEALKPDEILRVGGAGYKVMLLMEGHATAYVFASPGCKKWDTCAPEAILTAMGGRLTDIHGTPYSYASTEMHPNKRGVLAAAKSDDHKWFVENIPDEVKQLVKGS
uniref:3'(2'),5'-bisphosphate nucleotidase 1 n=1 Tax=Daphnia galeata TaxID=27404 RepID=A0A8J2RIU6_9CRUS|nr:unnamed protein product [Daphnia galeata]